MYFNPRAPCGARRTEHGEAVIREKFQSTRPVWGATKAAAGDRPRQLISIHAPRVGRDSSFRRCPCTAAAFQSTRPVWGATRADGWRRYVLQHFNPRAPCGARRRGRLAAHAGMANFNPRAPCGALLGPALSLSLSTYFNPRAPCGARLQTEFSFERAAIFQSTRPVWGATTILARLSIPF